MIIFLLIHIVAAFYNYYCILGTEWNAYHSKQWHKYQAIFNTLIAISFSYYGNIYLGLQFLATRFLMFNPILNLLRKKGFFYLGNHGMDLIFIKLFKKFAGYIYFIGAIIVVVTLYLFKSKIINYGR